MVKPDVAFLAPEPLHGFPCSLVLFVGLVAVVKRGGFISGRTNGDGAPATADPA